MEADLFYSKDLEQQFLAIIFNDNKKLDEAMLSIDEELFYVEAHKEIFKAIKNFWIRREPLEITLFLDCNKKKIDLLGGFVYASNLLMSYVTSVTYKSIKKELLNYKTKREYREFKNKLSLYLDDNDSIDLEKLKELKSNFVEIGENNEERAYKTLSEIAKVVDSDVDRRIASKDGISGIRTGLYNLDNAINGLNKTNFVIIGARPGMGKTTLANNIALNVAKGGNKVAIFNLEMTEEQIYEKILSSNSALEHNKISRGRLRGEDYNHYKNSSRELAKLENNLTIVSEKTLESIIRIAKKLHKQGKLEVLVVDYLQIMDTSRRTNTREQEVSYMSRQLKLLALELEITVIALSQLSRTLESRADKRPILSDLRESGGIENDADIIMFCYRDAYYTKVEDGTMEVIIGKNRNGEVSTINLAWIPEYQRVEDMTFHCEEKYENVPF